MTHDVAAVLVEFGQRSDYGVGEVKKRMAEEIIRLRKALAAYDTPPSRNPLIRDRIEDPYDPANRPRIRPADGAETLVTGLTVDKDGNATRVHVKPEEK